MSRPRKRLAAGITAAELMAELAAEPEFQRAKSEREAEMAARERVWREAERPIIDDLRLAGVDVSSPWDLVNTSEPYPDALPVLLDHLERGGYPDRVMAGLARALAVRPAAFAWDVLRRLYLNAVGPEEREGLAVALAATARPQNFDQMVDLLTEAGCGSSRIHLLRAIRRVGGTAGVELIATLRNDPVLGREATAILQRRRTR